MLILQFHFRICDQSPTKKNKNKQNLLKNNFKKKNLKAKFTKALTLQCYRQPKCHSCEQDTRWSGKTKEKIKNQIPQETKKVGSDYNISLQCAEQEPTCPIPSSMILVVKQSPQHCMQNLCPHSRPVKYQERKHTFLPNKSSSCAT